MNLNDLLKLFQDNRNNITINVTVNGQAVEDSNIDTDFEVGDRVLVCHRRKDGTPVHTWGEVDSIGSDDVGDYVRVTGDNGKHYKTGTHYNEVRLGTCIVEIED